DWSSDVCSSDLGKDFGDSRAEKRSGFRIDVLFRKIDPGFQVGEGFQEEVAGFDGAFSEVSFELAARGAEGEAGLRGDEVHHALGLGQIELSVQEGALGELAGAGGDGSAGKEAAQYLPGDEHAAVAGKLDAVFACIAVRTTENREQSVVDDAAIAFDDPAEVHRPREQPGG